MKQKIVKQKDVKSQSGITLIALVITIIVLLILAGISINTLFGENGIVNKAKEAISKTNAAHAQEAVSMGWATCETGYRAEGSEVQKQTYFEQNLKECIDSQDSNGKYKDDSIIDVESVSTIKYVYKKVEYTFYIGPNGEISAGKVEPSYYKLVGDVYCNSPDLSGFAANSTYYVTYDDEGNETIGGSIGATEAPADWYDYSEGQKKWANVVTKNNDLVAYWVWIPKYVYSLDKTNQITNIYFVSQDTDASASEYTYRTADGGGTLSASEYKMPESFTFDGKNLAGFWMSKYELSGEYKNPESIEYSISGNKAYITTDNPVGEYIVFINDEKIYTGTLPYELDGEPGKRYNVRLINRTNGPVAESRDFIMPDFSKIKVDLSGFDKNSTYYVLYSDDGQNIESENIPISQTLTQEQKEKWYDYSKKRWANIKTVSTDGNLTAYWTYIPRYEYKALNTQQETEINYIDTETTTPSEGYKIPESFTFGGKNLAGIWMSKYELSGEYKNPESIEYSVSGNKVYITTDNPKGEYDVYVNNEKKYTGTLPYAMEANFGQRYEVRLFSKTNGPVVEIRDFIMPNASKIKVDLSGFNQNNTYYVLYSDDGQTVESENIPISQTLTQEQKEKWYDYNKKKWANIKTVSEDGKLTAYWTYIPRYEYKVLNTQQEIEINYIDENTTTPSEGYKIPESFTFGGKNLAGIWMSKYELSSK